MEFPKKKINTVQNIDALNGFRELPDECVDMIITSPPYFWLRDYGTAIWEGGNPKCDHVADKNKTKIFGNEEFQKNRPSREETKTPGYYYRDICGKCGAVKKDLQLGLESTFEEYINKLCDIFDEGKRVLKKEGTCWINLGDTYSGIKVGNTETQKNKKVSKNNSNFKKQKQTIPAKSLLNVPARFSIEMQNRGWILRNVIIWQKPNCMPQSVTDRFTVDFEYLFFFVQNKKYYFETQYEPYAPSSDVRYRQALRAGRSYNSKEPYKKNTPYAGGKYKRGVGAVSSRGDDVDGLVVGGYNPNGRVHRSVWSIPTKPYSDAHFAVFPKKLIETPIKSGCPKEGIVLDPFMGSGTTAVTARELGRNYFGFEIKKDYIKLAEKRLAQQKLI